MSNPSQGATYFLDNLRKALAHAGVKDANYATQDRVSAFALLLQLSDGGSQCQNKNAGQLGKLRLPALLAHTPSWTSFCYSYFSQDCVNIINPMLATFVAMLLNFWNAFSVLIYMSGCIEF